VLRAAWTLYRRSGLQGLLRRSGVLGRGALARLESFVPERADAVAGASVGAAKTDVPAITVFRGCATDLFERDAIAATETLLAAAGYAVRSAEGQGCCGALHQHAGLTDEARALARRNVAAFADVRIATLTSGCAATLRDYAQLLPGRDAEMPGRVDEFSHWLLQPHDAAPLSFTPLARPLRAALHVPCTAASTMKSEGSLRALLARVPGLEIVDIDAGFGCCGAAGSHFLTHPGQSDRMLAPKLDSIARLAPDIVLSGNVGCSLHLAAGLRRATAAAEPSTVREPPVARRSPGQAPPQVLHPATLLARQLVRPPRVP
jgi:glycolate oxidase iron-sulfur subunit